MRQYLFSEIHVRDLKEQNIKDKRTREIFFGTFEKLERASLSSKNIFLFTMRFFSAHSFNREPYEQVKEELYDDVETEGWNESENDLAVEAVRCILTSYRQQEQVYSKLRSSFLEKITEGFFEKKLELKHRIRLSHIKHEPLIKLGNKRFFSRYSRFCNWEIARIIRTLIRTSSVPRRPLMVYANSSILMAWCSFSN